MLIESAVCGCIEFCMLLVVRTHVFVRAFVYVFVCVCLRLCVCVCVCVCVFVCVCGIMCPSTVPSSTINRNYMAAVESARSKLKSMKSGSK